jgi:hypothetical protein
MPEKFGPAFVFAHPFVFAQLMGENEENIIKDNCNNHTTDHLHLRYAREGHEHRP